MSKKKKKKMPIVLTDSASNVRVWKEGAGFGKFQSLFLKFIFVLFYPKLFIKKKIEMDSDYVFSLFRRSEVKIGAELSSKSYKSQAELSLELLSLIQEEKGSFLGDRLERSYR